MRKTFNQFNDIEIPEFLQGEPWVDHSWGNDAMPIAIAFPSSELADNPKDDTPIVFAWVDFEDPEQRFMSNSPRYAIGICTYGTWGEDDNALLTDDVNEAAAFAAELLKKIIPATIEIAEVESVNVDALVIRKKIAELRFLLAGKKRDIAKTTKLSMLTIMQADVTYYEAEIERLVALLPTLPAFRNYVDATASEWRDE